MAVILLVTVLILQSVSLPVTGSKYVTGWEWTTSSLTLSCGSGTFISVGSASYWANIMWCKPYSSATYVARSKCNNRSTCYVSTTPYQFFPTNPCWGFSKKATVRYDCKSCPNGQYFTGSRCANVAVDGVWYKWTETSACTVTCGGGKISYSRKCIEPQHGGKACEGDASKTENCGEVKCPDELTITTVENPVDCIEKSKTSCTIKWKIESTHGDKIGNKQVKICEFSNGKTSSCKTSQFKNDAYERKFGKTRKISHSGEFVAVVSIDGVETISDAVTLNITANTTKKGKKEKKNKN